MAEAEGANGKAAFVWEREASDRLTEGKAVIAAPQLLITVFQAGAEVRWVGVASVEMALAYLELARLALEETRQKAVAARAMRELEQMPALSSPAALDALTRGRRGS